MQRSEDMPHGGMWEFPGGKVEDGENYENALQREIREELGVEIKNLQQLRPEEYQYPAKKIVLIPIICEIRSGNLHLSEHCAYMWLKVEKVVLSQLLEADRGIIHQLKALL